jgi:hypothetical protein
MQYSISMLSFSDISRLLQSTLGSPAPAMLALWANRFNCRSTGAGLLHAEGGG